MAEERKRVESKIVVKVEPRKRVETKIEVKVEPRKRVETKPIPKQDVEIKADVEVKTDSEDVELLAFKEMRSKSAKRNTDEYVKYSLNDYKNNFRFISERLQKNEIKFAYGAVDGDDYIFHYIINK